MYLNIYLKYVNFLDIKAIEILLNPYKQKYKMRFKNVIIATGRKEKNLGKSKRKRNICHIS